VDILLKQRLIGAIVLISLAVIFLPMVFTGRGEQEKKFESSIPPEPVYEITAPQVSVPLPVPPESMQKVPLSEPVDQDQQMPLAEIIAKQTTTRAEPEAKADSPPEVSTPPEVAKVETAPPLAPPTTAAPKAEPVVENKPEIQKETQPKSEAKAAPTVEPSDVTGWVVQVGSFSKQANAEQLRDKLRKLGMASFVVTGVSDNQTVYRVRVGPEVDRKEAEKLQAKIKQKTKLNGLVMKYP